jgi:hypothetical protein
MVMHLPAPWMAGVVLGLSFLGCCLVLRFLPEIPAESRDVPLARAIRNVGVDLWVVVKSRTGLLCAILCFLPIGTGAATGVLAQAEVAAHWHAGENEVELVNGLLSGLIAAIGCLAGGWFCTRYSPRRVYAAVGACMAAVSLSMAAAPDTPATFVVFGLSYSFVTGMAYAAFSGFVLEVIGAGAAATKYNVFAALSNMPIMYMGLILAWSVSRVGTHGMLVSEAAFGVGGIAVLALAATALRAGPGGTPVPVPAIEAVVEPAQD